MINLRTVPLSRQTILPWVVVLQRKDHQVLQVHQYRGPILGPECDLLVPCDSLAASRNQQELVVQVQDPDPQGRLKEMSVVHQAAPRLPEEVRPQGLEEVHPQELAEVRLQVVALGLQAHPELRGGLLYVVLLRELDLERVVI